MFYIDYYEEDFLVLLKGQTPIAMSHKGQSVISFITHVVRIYAQPYINLVGNIGLCDIVSLSDGVRMMGLLEIKPDRADETMKVWLEK